MQLRVLSFIVATSLLGTTSWADDLPVYRNPAALLKQRVEALFQAMTPAECLTLLSGTGFTTQPVPRLGVPPTAMVDASQGVRGGSGSTQGKACSPASDEGIDVIHCIFRPKTREALRK
jgi:hypothetical protein